MKKRAIAYVRVSSKSQDINVQKEAIRKFAKEHGYEITLWYEDKGESGLKSYKNLSIPSRMLLQVYIWVF